MSIHSAFSKKRSVPKGTSLICQKCENLVDNQCQQDDVDLYETGTKSLGATFCNRLSWTDFWMNEYFGEDQESDEEE